MQFIDFTASSALDLHKTLFIYSSILFCLLVPIILISQRRFPLLASGLCWIVILRLILPPNLSATFSMRALIEYLSLEQILPTSISTHTAAIETIPLSANNASAYETPLIMVLLLVLWISIASALVYKFYTKRRFFKKLIKHASHIRKPKLIQACAVWRTKFNIKRPVTLLSANGFSVPFTIGTLKPVIFIPKDLLNDGDEKNLEAVIAHEMAHIKRYDDLKILVLNCIHSIYFFNPILWFCIKRIHTLRELLCDQLVIGTNLISIDVYCKSLLHSLRRINADHSNEIVQAALGSSDYTQLKNRFYYIKRIKTMKQYSKQMIQLVIPLLAVVSLPMAAYQNSDHNKEDGNYIKINTDSKVDQNEHNEYMPLPEKKYPSPVRVGWLSSKYGNRPWPVGKHKGKTKFHNGIDIANEEGTAVYPIVEGTVKEAGYKRGWGKRVVIEHSEGLQSVYAHLKDLQVNGGETIGPQTSIGTMAGKKFNTTGPHLHFELHLNGNHIDPSHFVDLSSLGNR